MKFYSSSQTKKLSMFAVCVCSSAHGGQQQDASWFSGSCFSPHSNVWYSASKKPSLSNFRTFSKMFLILKYKSSISVTVTIDKDQQLCARRKTALWQPFYNKTGF